MALELSPADQLTYSTARIECVTPTGPSSGTGFFFRFLEDGETSIPALVTNRHVVRGATSGKFHLTVRRSDGGPQPRQHTPITLGDFENQWIGHPDPTVDLCILPLGVAFSVTGHDINHFFFITLNGALIPSSHELDQLTAVEEITMAGYPNGIWDSVNNMPIVRRGITATHPKLDYDGRPEFMIDAACFPGSSGSPVLLMNLGGYPSADGGFVIGSRLKLLGILYAGPQHTVEGEIKIVEVPTAQQPIALSRIPNNLGLVIKAWRLEEFNALLRSLLANQGADAVSRD